GRSIWRNDERNKKMKGFLSKGAIAILVVGSMLLLPVAARAGVADIITLINTITNTLENSVGGVLTEIRSLESTLNNFRQEVLFPISLVNQAKSLAGQMRAQFSTLAGQIHAFDISSASLANSQQLESVIRNGQTLSLSRIQPAFSKLYAPLPL